MKKVWRYINRSLTRQLFLSIVSVAVIIMIILSTVIVGISQHIVRERAVDATQRETEASLLNLESSFKTVEAVCDSVQDSQFFQEQLREDFPDVSTRFSRELDGNFELAGIVRGRTEIQELYVLGENLICCKSDRSAFRYSSYLHMNWFMQAMETKEAVWYGFHEGSFVSNIKHEMFITYCQPYIDVVTGDANGVIVVEIGEDIIDSAFVSGGNEGSVFLLLDKEGHLIYHGQNSWITEQDLERIEVRMQDSPDSENAYLTEEDTVVYLEDDILTVYCSSAVTGWTLVGVSSMEDVNRSINFIWVITICVLAAMFLVMMLISIRLVRKFTRPIVELQTAMKSVEEGDLAICLENKGENELSSLVGSFNHMVKRLRALINHIYENQSKLRKLEFRALQAQIKPHFLYNSMDSVAWLLRMGRSEEAANMLQDLSVLFRISLSKGQELIPVRSELKHLNSYLSILSLRYSSRFEATVEVEDGLEDYTALKLMLQPLVENSIYHGVSAEKGVLHIKVSVMDAGEDILFCVEDDGVGMKEEQVEALRKQVYQRPDEEDVQTNPEGGGYGLRNVDERVKLYFGMEYGLSIDSWLGEGTAITIRIPKRTTQKNG